jgi:E3 ubiquitin-protein ligase RNF115/126
MSGLLAAMGADAATMNAHAHHHGGAEGPFAGGANPNDSGGIFQLFTSLGMGGPGGNMGDFVHSQEGLDRIVSQLMEQTATSNAPPPAPQAAIDSLPRKHVDEEMLGAEHTAECSICMDEVNIGEEVTVLPCKHWFHHACVSAWLSEHDTCPHCRKGISQDQNAPPPSSPQTPRSRQMPGSFDDSSAPQDPPNATSSDTTMGSGGISDRIRRGLFGPQQ